MKFYSTLALAATALMALAAPASAVVVIDQNQPVATGTFSFLEPAGKAAQSLVQTANNIAGAGIFLTPSAGSVTANVTIALWTNLPTAGGALIISRNGDCHFI